jgi:poly(3-hydroxybutyrate) depolymerase
MGPIEHTRWQLDTSLKADQVAAALVDFSPRRQVVWKETCDPAVYRVHAVGHTWADAVSYTH